MGYGKPVPAPDWFDPHTVIYADGKPLDIAWRYHAALVMRYGAGANHDRLTDGERSYYRFCYGPRPRLEAYYCRIPPGGARVKYRPGIPLPVLTTG